MSHNGLIFKPTDDQGLVAMARRALAGLPGIAPTDAVATEMAQPLLYDELLLWIDRRRWWLLGMMLCFYIAAFNGQWRIQADSALYLAIGRNLAHGRGFTYLGRSNQLAYPGWPCVIAGVFKVFGSDSLVPVNACMTLIALATVALVYRLFLLHCGRPIAVVVSIGVGLTKTFFCYGFELWSDMPFTLGAIAFLAGYEGIVQNPRKNAAAPWQRVLLDWTLLLGGLFTALAMRPTGWPLLLAFILALIVDAIHGRLNRRMLAAVLAAVTLTGAAVIFVGQLRHSHQGFGGVYLQYALNQLTQSTHAGLAHIINHNIHDLFAWAASDVLFQVRLGPFFNAMLSAVIILLGFGLFRFRMLWGLWFCLLLVTILVAQKTLDRYFLPVLPLLVFAWWDALGRINRLLPRQWGNLAFLALLAFGAIANVTKVSGIVLQQRSRPFLASYDKGTYAAVPRFAEQLHTVIGPNAIVLGQAPYGRVTAYLSRRYVITAIEAPLVTDQQHPIYLIEPVDNQPIDKAATLYLKKAGLTAGAAVFTVNPPPEAGPDAVPLSLHATRPASP